MTYFLKDILRQPYELQRTIAHLSTGGDGMQTLDAVVAAIRDARHAEERATRDLLFLDRHHRYGKNAAETF